MRKFIPLISFLGALSLILFFHLTVRKTSVFSQSFASFSLSPDSATKSVGEMFDVNINLNTAGNTIIGADVSISFDPEKLEVVDADSTTTGIQVTPGALLPSPIVTANQANNTSGKILLSINTFSSFSGQGVFGTVRFKAKSQGSSTTVSFDLAPATKVTLENGNNILGSTTPGRYTIVGIVTPTPTTRTPTPSLITGWTFRGQVIEEVLPGKGVTGAIIELSGASSPTSPRVILDKTASISVGGPFNENGYFRVFSSTYYPYYFVKIIDTGGYDSVKAKCSIYGSPTCVVVDNSTLRWYFGHSGTKGSYRGSIFSISGPISTSGPVPITPTPTPIVMPVCPGDADRNRRVDIDDFNIVLIREFGKTGVLRSDFNSDGRVNILDFAILLKNFGKVCSLSSVRL